MSRFALACAAAALFATPVAAQHAAEGPSDRTTVGGYGEVHYVNRSGTATPGEVNFARFVVYLAHTFSDRVAFRSELELEDAKIEGGGTGGEVALEQAFLDYRLSDALTLRSGLILIPIGIINETHEPPTFNGVARPAFDHDVIPSTWREIGVGLVGHSAAGLSYRFYLVNGIRAEGFSDAEGIRGGRQEGHEASFANPSLTGRLEWARPGLKLGGSFWYGGTADQDADLGTGTFAAPVTVISLDARYEVGAASFRGEFATITVSDAAEINTAFGGAVGSRIAGGYIEGAYNLLQHLAPESSHRLNAFARHERFDTHASVPTGLTRDETLARRITTLGLSYKPTSNTAFKADFQMNRNAAGTGAFDVASLGVGYQF